MINRRVNKQTSGYFLSILVNTNNLVLLELLKVKLGGCIVQKPLNHSNTYTLLSKNAAILLEKVLPYLKIKNEQADACIAFQKTFDEKYSTKHGVPLNIINKRQKYKIILDKLKN